MLTEFPEDERKTIKQNKNFDNLFLPTEQESLRPVLWGWSKTWVISVNFQK